MFETYFDSYKGIIVQNDDPEMAGRCKVWIPQINMTVYKNWNDTRDQDKKFTSLGDNVNCSLSPEILLRLKNSLPWAVVKQPVFGMGTSGTYHADKDFTEFSNDSNSSIQQTQTNQLPGSSDPTNNVTNQLQNLLSNIAIPSSNSANKINNNSGSTSSAPSYINNATSTSNIQPVPNVSTIQNIKPITNDNINHVIITFNPNARNSQGNNRNRVFTSSATVTTNLGSATANTNAVGALQSTIFQSDGITPVNVPDASAPDSVPFSPPITYVPVDVAPISTPIEQSKNSASINVTFVPNARNALGNNKNRTFTTTASVIFSDGKSVTLNASAKGLTKVTNFSINADAIDSIGIVYNSESLPIDLTSARLGQLGNILSGYKNVPTKPSSNNDAIMPPTTISIPSYNKGSSGASLFNLVYSNLLPLSNMVNCLIRGVNPENVSGINYRKELPANVDPNKTVGSNQQTLADSLSPIRSSTQSDKVKGTISIPAVGAHVSVYFDNGDPMFPIIDGMFYSQEDFKGIHDVST